MEHRLLKLIDTIILNVNWDEEISVYSGETRAADVKSKMENVWRKQNQSGFKGELRKFPILVEGVN